VFLVNRSRTESVTVTIDVAELSVSRITEAVTLWDDDVYAKNTLEDQERVGLKTLESAALDDGTLTVVLSPVSWSAVALGS
jgi:alpha-N-arabinofuranosidase